MHNFLDAERNKSMSMDIRNLKIDAIGTVGSKLLLVDILPVYKYENGKRTDEVSGFRYIVAMPERELEKISVRIDGNLQIEKPENDFPVVEFDGLELSLYWTPSGYQVSAKANAISYAEE